MPHTTDKRAEIPGIDEVMLNTALLGGDTVKRDYPKDSVVYFIAKKNNRYYVDAGIVFGCYDDYVCLQLLERRDRRMVNGIPYKNFPDYTEWRKLPENFDWDNQLASLCELTFDGSVMDGEDVRINSPESILKAYKSGALVRVQDVDHSHLVADVDYKFGYRLRKTEYDRSRETSARLGVLSHTEHWPFIGIEYACCFTSYEDAKKNVDDFEAFIERQKHMSEEEFAIEQINHDIDRWALYYDKSEQEKATIRDSILSQSDVKDIETRIFDGNIEYRNWKKKKWIVAM